MRTERRQKGHETGSEPDPEPQTVTPAQVTAALEAIVNSEAFARADRARALLTYVVKTEQQGDAARLKGFTIAQDVFGKDDDFDPAMDAVVRVQAGRLREHLASYYAGEGRDDPVAISVPKGSYVPAYALRAAAEKETGSGSKADKGADGPIRSVDFGAPTTSFRLDGGNTDATPHVAEQIATGSEKSDALATPFIVRNVRRFWLALATIIVLLTVILALVWQR